MKQKQFACLALLLALAPLAGCAAEDVSEMEEEDDEAVDEATSPLTSIQPGHVVCTHGDKRADIYYKVSRGPAFVRIDTLSVRIDNGDTDGNKLQIYGKTSKVFSAGSIPDGSKRDFTVYKSFAPGTAVKFRAVFNRAFATDLSCSVTVTASAL